jgi:phasin family protein
MTAETQAPVETVVEAVEAKNEAAVNAATGEKTEKPDRKTAAKARRKARQAPKKAPRLTKQRRVAKQRNDDMTNETTNIFAGFGAFPAAAVFEKLFTEAANRGEEAVKRSRKAAEEIADLYRGNVDAFVEAGRIAASGAQSIGQDVAAKGRDSLEQTANTVRSFAEAKTPTELLQLQSDFARTAFDRFVEESSTLTESVVKLAGEAFQPLSNRASATVERFNQIAA